MLESRFLRRFVAVSFVAGPLLTLAGMLIGVREQDDDVRSYLTTYVGEPVRAQVSAVVLHFGFLLFVPVVLALAAVTWRRSPRLSHTGLLLGMLGTATLPGLLVVDFYDMAVANELPMDQAVAVEERVEGYAGIFVIFLPTLVGLLVGMVLLAIAAWRVGFAPWWSVGALAAGHLVLNVFRTTSLIPTFLGCGLLLLGGIDLARRILAHRTTAAGPVAPEPALLAAGSAR